MKQTVKKLNFKKATLVKLDNKTPNAMRGDWTDSRCTTLCPRGCL